MKAWSAAALTLIAAGLLAISLLLAQMTVELRNIANSVNGMYRVIK
jgi:hypothetical protein